MATLELPVAAGGPEPQGEAARAAGPYIWQAPGGKRRVSLELDVVDRILQEALRGLGSVPKRGAEVGGILLGAVSEDGTLCITGSVPVYCSHAQGSSYTLSNEEYREFAATVARCAPDEGRPAEAVGFYRTHTREGLGLSMDDVRVFDALFPGESPVILLVKPSVTRVSQGAFFFREEGGVQRTSSDLEFPFRRRELSGNAYGHGDHSTGGSAPVTDAEEPDSESISAPLGDRPSRSYLNRDQSFQEMDQQENPRGRTGPGLLGLGEGGSALETGDGGEGPSAELQRGKRLGRRWTLIPLSFLFLILGLFLGIQLALTLGPRLAAAAGTQGPITLDLRVAAAGQKIQLEWNRASPVIAGAQDGTLFIEDGGASSIVHLRHDQVVDREGILYTPTTGNVRFRLEIRLRDDASFSESIDFHRP